MKIRPLQDRIIVKRLEGEEKTKGGIIIPDSAKEKPAEGVVFAVGKGKVLEGALQAAAENGWTVERVGIDGRNASEVHGSVMSIVKETLRHAGAQEQRSD